jgi:hypothetical protein
LDIGFWLVGSVRSKGGEHFGFDWRVEIQPKVWSLYINSPQPLFYPSFSFLEISLILGCHLLLEELILGESLGFYLFFFQEPSKARFLLF